LGLDRNGTYPARAGPAGLAGPGRKIKENFFDFYPGKFLTRGYVAVYKESPSDRREGRSGTWTGARR